MGEMVIITKNWLIVAVLIIVIGSVGFFSASSQGCVLSKESVYTGQAVDAEQAFAKLTAFFNGLNRTQFSGDIFSNAVPLPGALLLNETQIRRVTNMKAVSNNTPMQANGFVIIVPYMNGNEKIFGDGYFMSIDDGRLYKMSRVNC